MKRIHAVAVITALTMLVLMLTACGKSEFSASADTGKRMTITAQNAAKEARCITGALEVAEGEQITVRANLTKGSVQVKLIAEPDAQNIDQPPELDGEAVITANISGTEETSGTVPAGSYMLEATCVEKATGTVLIAVEPSA